jgi:dTDP-4-dehydrorhamnose reductase
MRILVFGKTGQVATELARRKPSDIEVDFLDRRSADLADVASCVARIRESAAHAVINAAGWTAVDLAEAEEAAATAINAAAPAAMARACADRGLPFLHLSSDFVFDGLKAGTIPTDWPAAPLSAYGRSKLAGEIGVRSANGRHLILRTSWVFSAHGANFVKTILRLGAERSRLQVVSDQIGGPTPAAAIADALFGAARALRSGAAGGTHHFIGKPCVSKADFARAILGAAGLACEIEDVPGSAFVTPARRPPNSRLDCSAFKAAFGIDQPDWRSALRDVIEELGTAS